MSWLPNRGDIGYSPVNLRAVFLRRSRFGSCFNIIDKALDAGELLRDDTHVYQRGFVLAVRTEGTKVRGHHRLLSLLLTHKSGQLDHRFFGRDGDFLFVSCNEGIPGKLRSFAVIFEIVVYKIIQRMYPHGLNALDIEMFEYDPEKFSVSFETGR
jgi:hypothetical protein